LGEIDKDVTADREAVRAFLMRGERKRQTKTKETGEASKSDENEP
jgi:hypothetical protein